jgi:RNA polymerase sigma-70 factor (ECF subfamily)
MGMNFVDTAEDPSMEPTNGKLPPERWAVFEHCRQRLFGIVSRMLGSADDVEDLVQETSLRWLRADPATVRAPEGWLVAVITRLAIDRLRRAAKEREAYVEVALLGVLPPSESTTPNDPLDVDFQLSQAFLALRDRLEPTERTAFVLREVFDCDYEEIARLLQKSEAACRQVVRRARERVRQRRSRLALRRDVSPHLAERFRTALAAGDRDAVLAAFADDAADAPSRAPRTVRMHAGRPGRARPWHPSREASSRPSWNSDITTASPAA